MIHSCKSELSDIGESFQVKNLQALANGVGRGVFMSLTTSIWRMQRTSFYLGIVKTLQRFMI